LSQGWLLAIEGIDGAGKTTQARLLATALEAIGHRVVLTKGPTEGPHGQKIRALSTSGADIPLEEELQYFLDDRREHIDTCVAPALKDGAVVITDRYFYSNVAYQGARGLDPAEILTRNEALFPTPAAVLLIEVSPKEGLRRVTERGGELNLAYERTDFLEAAAAVFASIDRAVVHRIDGEQSPDAVHAAVRACLAPLFDF
jgi:dTMP kinase